MEHDVLTGTVRLAAALAEHDAAAAAALYAFDGRLLASGAAVIRGRMEIERYWRTGLDVGLSHVELLTDELEVDAAVAVEVGHYSLVVSSGAAERGKYVVLHRLDADGAWRRAVDVFNPDVPTGRTQPEEEA